MGLRPTTGVPVGGGGESGTHRGETAQRHTGETATHAPPTRRPHATHTPPTRQEPAGPGADPPCPHLNFGCPASGAVRRWIPCLEPPVRGAAARRPRQVHAAPMLPPPS